MGKIVLENFNEGDGYYKVNLAYLSKEQVEEIESLVSKWNPTDEDIKSCIEMCLTDANEQRFKAYGTTLEDCLNWLEKQGKKSPFNKERLMKVEKHETFEEQIKHWQGMCSIAEKIGKKLLEKQGKEKSKWTEEDEKTMKTAISFLIEFKNKGYENAVACIDWLNSIKQRMEEQQ